MPAASVRAAAAAVSYLTRVPVGRIELERVDVQRGAILFPVVGSGVGALAGVAALGVHHRLSSFLSAAIAVGVLGLLTGALHLDALADTADALGQPRDRALEIMRDPRIGSFGAVAVALDLITKTGAVAQLLDHGGAFVSLVAAAALARAAPIVLAATLPYPRAEAGRGGVFAGDRPRSAAAGAALLAAAIAIAVAGWHGAVLGGVAAASTLGLALAFRAWLGGAAGDCLGAATEIAETLALVVAAALA